ncbi:MAG: hypothetical protein AB7S39_08690 [Gemmatimonadales bacterium]
MTTTPTWTWSRVIRQQGLVPFVPAVVALLTFVDWRLSPEQGMALLGPLARVAALWAGLTLVHWLWLRPGCHPDREAEARARYGAAVVALMVVPAGVIETARLGLRLFGVAVGAPVVPDTQARVLALTVGALLLVGGNVLPKILTPLTMLPRGRAHLVTAARRFVGMVLMFVGAAVWVLFLSLPVAEARSIGRVGPVLILVSIVGAVLWMNLAPSRDDDGPAPDPVGSRNS